MIVIYEIALTTDYHYHENEFDKQRHTIQKHIINM